MSAIRSQLSHVSSIRATHSLCSSYIDSDVHVPDMPDSLSKYYSCGTDSSDDENEYSPFIKPAFHSDRACGQVKEEDMQVQLAQAYGFTLKLVDDSGYSCLKCHWLQGCTGCVIPADDTPLLCMAFSRKIAIDWDPAFIMSHHQVLYDYMITHNSVESVSLAGKQSILLQECLQRFVQTEVLQGDQKPRCEQVRVVCPFDVCVVCDV